ncbi:MAG: hypothetical protein EXR79_10060 [Myxococcales bacterium]|nr:hypothetical protein [Myxococcales bacterium]
MTPPCAIATPCRRVRLDAPRAALTVALLVGTACSNAAPTPGGGVAAIRCQTQTDCPGALVCANTYCVTAAVAGDAAPATSDTATPGQDAGTTAPADAKPAGKDGDDKADAPGRNLDVSVADVAPPVDVASGQDVSIEPDLPPSDTGADAAPQPMTILEVQSAATSLTCTSPTTTVTTAASVQLESAVVTGDPSSLNTTLWTFFVMPASGPIDGKYAGLQVVVPGSTPPAVKAGHVVALKGSIKEFFCNTELQVALPDVMVTGKLAAPQPYIVPPAKLRTDVAEPYEGVFVRVDNVVVVDPNPKGDDGKPHGEFTVGAIPGLMDTWVSPSPGVTWTAKNPATGAIETKFFKGQKLISVAGHAWYSFGHFAVRARTDADVVKALE